MAEAGNSEFPTILGPDATFKGELSFEKGMRLHGRFEGKLSTKTGKAGDRFEKGMDSRQAA